MSHTGAGWRRCRCVVRARGAGAGCGALCCPHISCKGGVPSSCCRSMPAATAAQAAPTQPPRPRPQPRCPPPGAPRRARAAARTRGGRASSCSPLCLAWPCSRRDGRAQRRVRGGQSGGDRQLRGRQRARSEQKRKAARHHGRRGDNADDANAPVHGLARARGPRPLARGARRKALPAHLAPMVPLAKGPQRGGARLEAKGEEGRRTRPISYQRCGYFPDRRPRQYLGAQVFDIRSHFAWRHQRGCAPAQARWILVQHADA